MKIWIPVIVVALLIAGAAYYYSAEKAPENTGAMQADDIVPPPSDSGDGGINISAEFSGKILAGAQAKLLEFNPADYNKAVSSDKLVVLYFYANWCPICKKEFPEAQAAFNELQSDQVVGFRVSYNDDEVTPEEKALAREFGVAYQHTKVFIKNGKQVLKAPDGWDKTRYLAEIQKAL